MSKIQIHEGTWNKSCTTEKDLIRNEMKAPVISDVLTYSEKRMITTLIVSGAKKPYQTAVGNTEIKTKIGTIPKGSLIGSNAYRYRIMGRIQQSSVISRQIGTSGADGSFSLAMKDDYLYPGMNALFNGQLFEARVMAGGTSAGGEYVYEFQSTDGTVFDWTTHVAGQAGDYTCFGGYTSYGEKSLRGFSRSHTPDMFVNHTTIQRKSIAYSGSTASSVIWIKFGKESGWVDEQVRQGRVQLIMEDEHAKIWGRSSMRNTDGSLRGKSRLIDRETGLEITKGDGLWPQLEGTNEIYTSGTAGKPIYEDFTDMMTLLKKKAPMTTGNVWYAMTGAKGMSYAQEALGAKALDYNLTINKNGSTKVGGPDVEVGYNFNTLNVDGNQVVFVEHPMFSDDQRHTEQAENGDYKMDSSFVFLSKMTNQGKQNIEILGRGAYGNNRTMVSGTLHGLSGTINKLGGQLTSSVDADEYNALKEDGIFMYDTSCSGILTRTTS